MTVIDSKKFKYQIGKTGKQCLVGMIEHMKQPLFCKIMIYKFR